MAAFLVINTLIVQNAGHRSGTTKNLFNLFNPFNLRSLVNGVGFLAAVRQAAVGAGVGSQLVGVVAGFLDGGA